MREIVEKEKSTTQLEKNIKDREKEIVEIRNYNEETGLDISFFDRDLELTNEIQELKVSNKELLERNRELEQKSRESEQRLNLILSQIGNNTQQPIHIYNYPIGSVTSGRGGDSEVYVISTPNQTCLTTPQSLLNHQTS